MTHKPLQPTSAAHLAAMVRTQAAVFSPDDPALLIKYGANALGMLALLLQAAPDTQPIETICKVCQELTSP